MSRERRAYPRYPVEFPLQVTVVGDDAADAVTTYPARAETLSRTSVEISCNADLVAALLRQRQLPYACGVAFSLDQDFAFRAQVITHRRRSQHRYVLVLLFVHEDALLEQALERSLQGNQSVGLD